MNKQIISVAIIIAGMAFLDLPAVGQAPLPAVDMGAVASAIQRDFGSVDQIRTIGMTDNPDERFDLVVVGSRPKNDGWRVEVFSVSQHRLERKWDSVVMAREPEYASSGPKAVTIKVKDYDYEVLVEGCIPHECHDGVSGFVLFSGQSGETSKAKVVTRGLAKSETGPPKYDVTFSQNISARSRDALEDAICNDRSISNKSGLPFECKNP